MGEISDIPICILAGGNSQRFGANKALAKLGDKAMIEHVLDRLRGQTTGPIAVNANTSEELAVFGCPIVPDTRWEGSGPLAGVSSAMKWAQKAGYQRVITVAVDVPFLPLDFVARLQASADSAIAVTKEQWHPVIGVWDVCQLKALDAYLASGKRSAHGWAENTKANTVLFEQRNGAIDPFWNVNTAEDMAMAEDMLKNG